MSQTGLYHRGGIAVPEIVYQGVGEVVLEGTEHGREKYAPDVKYSFMEVKKLSIDLTVSWDEKLSQV